MNFKKNLLTITVAFLLVFSLASCGPGNREVVDNIPNLSETGSTESPIESNDNTIKEDDESNKAGRSDGDSDTSKENTGDRVFTLEELSTYNGRNGMPAYVAVDGVVYDVSDAGAWRNGQHNGFTAGKDLTDEIKEVSPHGVKNLEGIPVVGTLVSE